MRDKGKIYTFFRGLAFLIKRKNVKQFSKEDNQALDDFARELPQVLETARNNPEPVPEEYSKVIKNIEGILEKEQDAIGLIVDRFLPNDNDTQKTPLRFLFDKWSNLKKGEGVKILKFCARNAGAILKIAANYKVFSSPKFQAEFAKSDKLWDFAGGLIASESRFKELINVVFYTTMPRVLMPVGGEPIIFNKTAAKGEHYQELLSDFAESQEQQKKLSDVLKRPELIELVLKDPDAPGSKEFKHLNPSDLKVLRKVFANEKECKVRLEVMDGLGFEGSRKAELRKFLTDTDNFWVMWFYLVTPEKDHQALVTERYMNIMFENEAVKSLKEAKSIMGERKAFFDKNKKDIQTIMALEESIVRPQQIANNLKVDKEVEKLLKALLVEPKMRPLLTELLGDPEMLTFFGVKHDVMVINDATNFLKILLKKISESQEISAVLSANPEIVSHLGLFVVQSTPWIQDMLKVSGIKEDAIKLGDAIVKYPKLLVEILEGNEELDIKKIALSAVTLANLIAKDKSLNGKEAIITELLNNFLVPVLGSNKAKLVAAFVIDNIQNKRVSANLIGAIKSEEFTKLLEASKKGTVPTIQAGLAFLKNKDIQKIIKADKAKFQDLYNAFVGSALPEGPKKLVFELLMGDITNQKFITNLSTAVSNPNFQALLEASKDAQSNPIPLIQAGIALLGDTGIQGIIENDKTQFKKIFDAFIGGAIAEGPRKLIFELLMKDITDPKFIANLSEATKNKNFQALLEASKDGLSNPIPLIQAGIALLGDKGIQEIIKNDQAQFKKIFDAFIGEAIAEGPKEKIFRLLMDNMANPQIAVSLAAVVENPNFLKLLTAKDQASSIKLGIELLGDKNIQKIIQNDRKQFEEIYNAFVGKSLEEGQRKIIFELVLSNLTNQEFITNLSALAESPRFLNLLKLSTTSAVATDSAASMKALMTEKALVLNMLDLISDVHTQAVFKGNEKQLKTIVESFLVSVPEGIRGAITDLIIANATDKIILAGVRAALNNNYIKLSSTFKEHFPAQTTSDYNALLLATLKFVNSEGIRNVLLRDNKQLQALLSEVVASYAGVNKAEADKIVGYVVTNFTDPNQIKNVISVLEMNQKGELYTLSNLKSAMSMIISAELSMLKPSNILNAATLVYSYATSSKPFSERFVDAVFGEVSISEDKKIFKTNIDEAISNLKPPVNELVTDTSFFEVLYNYVGSKGKAKVTSGDIEKAFVHYYNHIERMTELMCESNQVTSSAGRRSVREAIEAALVVDKSLSFQLLNVGKNVLQTSKPQSSALYEWASYAASFLVTDNVQLEPESVKKAIKDYIRTERGNISEERTN